MTPEVKTLWHAYRRVLRGEEAENFIDLLHASDQERLYSLASVNSVRPVLYAALQSSHVADVAYFNKLQRYCTLSALKDKVLGQEISRLHQLLWAKGIENLPYKGFLFTERLYQGKHLRETADMDLVLRNENDLAEALSILDVEGYECLDEIELDIQNLPGRELSLWKSGLGEMKMPLDLHWGVSEAYHFYNISPESFFSDAVFDKALIPSEQSIFSMILIHHGGRGCWLKLKEVFDFATFVDLHNDKPLDRWAQALRMQKVYETGLETIQYLDSGVAKSGLVKDIASFWNMDSRYDNQLRWKLKKWRIYLRMQEPQISRLKLFVSYITYHGTNTPLYEKYPKPFGGRFKVLNSMAKFSTIMLRSIKGAYK
jgi:hypothetical protein